MGLEKRKEKERKGRYSGNEAIRSIQLRDNLPSSGPFPRAMRSRRLLASSCRVMANSVCDGLLLLSLTVV